MDSTLSFKKSKQRASDSSDVSIDAFTPYQITEIKN